MDKKSILIADDNEINREILSEFFSNKYNIITASNGEEAIEKINQYEREIVLVLLDVRMPVIDGFGVVEYLSGKSMIEYTAVVMITGSDDYHVEIKAFDLGVSDFIHKPFIPEIVVKRCETAIEYKQRQYNIINSANKLVEAIEVDSLTGLNTVSSLGTKVTPLLKREDKNKLSFAFCNIINFKYYNVRYGIEAGDRVLIDLARFINKSGEDIVAARYSNDCFIIVTDKDNSELSNRINDIVIHFHYKYAKVGLKIKFGVYNVKEDCDNALIGAELAKVACDSIHDSQDSIGFYDGGLEHGVEMEGYVLQNIDLAINKGYIKAFYQPVIRTISGKVCGLEALARWIDPVRGFLSPGEFIPVLEKNRMITKLDIHMLRIICTDIKRELDNRKAVVPVSFNLSRYDFLECDCFKTVENIIDEYEIPRDLINVEITESTVMDNPEFLKNEINRFREGGYQVWMDDFGSGYSSLNVLKDFKFDEIKLDMKFLSTFNSESKTIIKSIILMAKELNMQTLAEGVETIEQFEFLKAVGCEKAQGYLFSKPLARNELVSKELISSSTIENKAFRKYYNSVGTVNFMTDRAMSIIEFDGDRFEYLFSNRAYSDVWNSIGASDMAVIYQALNIKIYPIYKKIRDVQAIISTGDDSVEIFYTYNGHHIKFVMKCLARLDKHSIFDFEIINLSNPQEDINERLDYIYRMMSNVYDSIYLLDLNRNTFETIAYGASNIVEDSKVFHSKKAVNPALASTLFIHPEDQDEFARFTDRDTLMDRLIESEKGLIMQYFRTRTNKGEYVWKLHAMLCLKEIDAVLYFSMPAIVNESEVASMMDRLD